MYGQYGPRVKRWRNEPPKFIGIRSVMSQIKEMQDGDMLGVAWSSTDKCVWTYKVDNVQEYVKQEFPIEFYVLINNVHKWNTNIVLTCKVTSKQLKELLIIAKSMCKK